MKMKTNKQKDPVHGSEWLNTNKHEVEVGRVL